MDQLHWGVIGSIEKAQAFAADFPYASESHILYSILAPEETAPQSSGFPPHVYSDISEFLQSDIDAVYITTKGTNHYAQVLQCLQQHKAVLCEKPIAQNATELRHLIEQSQAQETFMMEAMWVRFLPSIKKVLSIVSSGTIGEIVSIKSSVNYKTPEGSQKRNGALLTDLGSYPVFLCVLFLGRPDFVEAKSNKNSQAGSEFVSAFLSYVEGQYAFIEASSVNRASYASIEGEKGIVHIRNPWSAKPEGVEVEFFDGNKTFHKAEWEGNGFQFEIDEVYKCMQEDLLESQLYCQHFSLDVMQTMDDIRAKLK